MLRQLRPAILSLLLLTLLTGLIYPLVVTGLAQVIFPRQAKGSLIGKDGKPVAKDGQPVGSALLGQPFDDPRYFWGRLSATTPYPYNATASGGSNYGPLNPALIDPDPAKGAVAGRIAALRDAAKALGVEQPGPVPVDLVTSSASGLDPDISPAAAEYQVARVAKARKLEAAAVRRLVAQHTQARQLGVLGEPRVNVLELNLALDRR